MKGLETAIWAALKIMGFGLQFTGLTGLMLFALAGMRGLIRRIIEL